MKIILDDFWGDKKIPIKKGMAYILITDDGLKGAGAQSVQTQRPHTNLHLFKNEHSMRSFAEKNLKDSGKLVKNHRVHYGVVGDWSTDNFSLTIHE